MQARTGAEILKGLEQVEGLGPSIKTPVWIGHSKADTLSPFESSATWLKSLNVPSRELYPVPNCRHEPWNEFNRQDTFDELLGWLTRTL